MTQLAVKYGATKFVMISTDKSVNPTSVMGVSKRICEKKSRLQHNQRITRHNL
jgi:FlaA1/EpsC-like NDP-sugar epimerase